MKADYVANFRHALILTFYGSFSSYT